MATDQGKVFVEKENRIQKNCAHSLNFDEWHKRRQNTRARTTREDDTTRGERGKLEFRRSPEKNETKLALSSFNQE